MADLICSIPECGSPQRARGWCSAHYQRWTAHGDPLGKGKIMLPWPENLLRRLRFMPPTTMSTGCVEFTGALNKGYGITRKDGRQAQAHRASYELIVGPIPDGLHIDHLCENPPCVNPGHLEPVTHAENMRRYAKALPHCKIDGCTGQVHGYGWCVRHYGRWRRHGDPLAGRRSPRAVSEGGSISEGTHE